MKTTWNSTRKGQKRKTQRNIVKSENKERKVQGLIKKKKKKENEQTLMNCELLNMLYVLWPFCSI